MRASRCNIPTFAQTAARPLPPDSPDFDSDSSPSSPPPDHSSPVHVLSPKSMATPVPYL